MSGPARIQKSFILPLTQGLHLRPAGIFVQTVNRFRANILISKGGDNINGKSILSVMTLEAAYGSKLEVIVEGPDAKPAMEALDKLFGDWKKDPDEKNVQ